MSSSIKPRWLLVAMVLALAAGAGTAVVAAGSNRIAMGTDLITLEGAVEKRLTIKGSDANETITITGDAAGDLQLQADREFEDMRTDCTTAGPTNATCTSEYSKVEAELEQGSDGLTFKQFTARGMRAVVAGAAGADTVIGPNAADLLEGGRGGDTLRGKDGPDELDGGDGHDDCDGGKGKDTLRHCE